MTRNLFRGASLFASFLLLLAPVSASCTSHPADNGAHAALQSKPRTKGAIFRSEIDRLIATIAAKTQREGTAAPYSDAPLAAAQILCAMGHCHRFYVAADNPRLRATIAMLLQKRRPDGSFGNGSGDAAAVTPWVIDALTILDGEHYRDEIATAEQWLQKKGLPTSAFTEVVQSLLAQVRGDVFPEHLAQEALAFCADASAKTIDEQIAAGALLHLVACQEANRRLDTPQGQEKGAAAVQFSAAQQKAFDFLFSQQKDGVFNATFGGKTFPDPAFTGFGMLALQTKPKSMRTAAESTAIDKGLAWLLQGQNEDGSFGQQLQNYTTSVVIGALVRAANPEWKGAIAKAQAYILKCQNVESSGYQSGDRDYGSIGYGGSQRGDLSNVNFALQALRESGLPADHEALQKALVFLRRTQNLKSVNDFAGKVSDPDNGGKLMDVTSGDDGGAAYYPGNSAAGYMVTPDGKSMPRSYGSMTYALLKSYTLCGVGKDDPRVQKCVEWLGKNWTLDENPGFEVPVGDKARYAGLFYYYMVLSQSLDMAGIDQVQTKDGKPISWRQDLRAQLEKMQQNNGSWTNAKNPRWMEGVDVLCTCYAMLALERCR